jgi:hypothetical protein
MNRITITIWFLVWSAIPSLAADFTAWRWQQAAEVKTPGVWSIQLPPSTLDASQPTLADIRLISPDGVETPWFLEPSRQRRPVEAPVAGFKVTVQAGETVLTAMQSTGRIAGINLQSPARDFLKSIRIEGSDDGVTWHPLAEDELVFRQSDGAARLQVPFEPVEWKSLRVTIRDDRTQQVPFTGMTVVPAAARSITTPHPVTLASREEHGPETRLTLDLGAANLDLDSLQLEIAEAAFNRACLIETADQAGSTAVIATVGIRRTPAIDPAMPAILRIDAGRRIPTRRLTLRILNGDNPPLTIRAASALRHPDPVVFFANKAGEWKLLTGFRQATAPRYDVTALRNDFTRGNLGELTPGPLTAKPDHRSPTALPEVPTQGGPIDLAGWGRRRPVEITTPGVIHLELDAVTLAGMAHPADLADLRLVQDGRQIPWLRTDAHPQRTLPATVTETPDPERPAMSRWSITLPVDGLPAASLTATSPDPLFSRDLVLTGRTVDRLGNRIPATFGNSAWTVSPDMPAARRTLDMNLGGTRLPRELTLETDNRDNPPIRIAQVSIAFQAPVIAARTTHGGPVLLYYDNPGSKAPDYDLALVRDELLAADAATARLGPEEVLKPAKRREPGAGSPWLWAALAIVVALLLTVVAKLLPRATSSPSAPGKA